MALVACTFLSKLRGFACISAYQVSSAAGHERWDLLCSALQIEELHKDVYGLSTAGVYVCLKNLPLSNLLKAILLELVILLQMVLLLRC